MKTQLFLTAILVLGTVPAFADAGCANLPAPVTDYLKSQDGWAVLSEDDLIPDQQTLWDQDHADECPGLAAVKLDGSTLSYAVAVIERPMEGLIYERLVLLSPDKGGFKNSELMGLEEMDFPSVVYRAPPGRVFDFHTHKYLPTPHDSIVYEHKDSITKTFFLSDGKMNLVQSSD